MAELGEGLSGYLDVQDATLRAPRIEAVSNIGVANTAPQHAFSVGSNLYIDTESSNVITVRGNVVTEGVKVGTIEIIPSYDLAAVSNVGNVTANTIIFTNETQGFVATGNATIGSTLTVSGFRITAAAAAEDDLEAITTAGATTSKAIHITNDTDSTTPYTGALQIGTNTGANGGLGVAGNVHVNQGVYTQDLSVSGEIVSNLAVNTDDLFVDIVNSRVGVGTTEPGATLEVTGNAYISGDLDIAGNLGSSLVNLIYPIGAVYISVNSADPGTIWSGTTWVAFGAGRTLVGIDSGDTDFDQVEETGGAKTHTLTTAQLPSHEHSYADRARTISAQGGYPNPTAQYNPNLATEDVTRTTGSAGSGQAHNNMQPYIVTYMWKRTA